MSIERFDLPEGASISSDASDATEILGRPVRVLDDHSGERADHLVAKLWLEPDGTLEIYVDTSAVAS